MPDSCISFYSPEGKKIFSEAIATGHMDCYFKLAAQFRTQEEPAYCGLTTLVMILNALEVDPGRVWKGPWTGSRTSKKQNDTASSVCTRASMDT